VLFHALPETDPGYSALRALIRVLDDGMSTRLHYQICDQKGLAYSVAGSLHSYHDAALLEVDAACSHAKLPALVTETLAMLGRFREELVGEDELDKAKRRFVSDVESSYDDLDGLCGWFGGTELYSPADAQDKRARALARVRPAEIREVARRVLRPERLSVTAVGSLGSALSRKVEKIVMGSQTLKYERDRNTVYVDFPETLRSGRTYSIEFHYSGQPREEGRFGALAFRTDPAGKHWITTANEGEGSASWWPSKDQWRDEPEGADIHVAVPNGLTNVSNGRFMGKTDLGDGYTRWDYRVHYPINSYNVSLNIAEYAHFSETFGDLTMDYFVLAGNLEKAKVQFAQAKPMIEAFEKYVGKYPFPKDGFKLIEVPYSGMEHQSAVTYGNRYANGYLERDWTGVGVSLKFDFIIIHESGHEWFGNAVSAADVSDMWIQEGWCNYLEFIYVEALFGREDAIKYANGYKSKIGNLEPIITQRGIHRTPNQDMYFKGALFLDTLRNAVNDDVIHFQIGRDP
jgi:aminopeptidase N